MKKMISILMMLALLCAAIPSFAEEDAAPRVLVSFLSRAGENYNVGTAKDGEEAIKIIEANKDNQHLKAILLDLNMPKVDGFGVLEYMRSNGLLDKIPVSIISGDSSKATIDRAFTYDIVDMISKPFNDRSITLVVEKTLMKNDL